MIIDCILGGAAVAGLSFTAYQDRARLREALRLIRSSLTQVGPAVCLAMLAAALLVPTMPGHELSQWIGPDSGLTGILIASCIGAFIPGGPMIAFPVVLIFQSSGAGIPQLTALLSGWSVVATHRMVAFELPLMGSRFTTRRLIASVAIPPLTGLCALALTI